MEVLNLGQYYGEIQKEIQMNNFCLSLTAYESQEEIPEHYHQNRYFSLLLKGSYIETSDKTTYNISGGNLVFRPQHYTHANQFINQQSFCFNIELFDNVSNNNIWEEISTFSIHCGAYPHASVTAFQLYKEFIQATDNLTMEELVISMMTDIDTSYETHKSKLDWLKQLLRIIHQEYDIHLDLTDLSDRISVHPIHLAKMFHKKMKCTLGEYIRKVRLSNAIKQLLNTNLPLVQIALNCGFYDQSHLNRVFKRYLGITPFQLRNHNL